MVADLQELVALEESARAAAITGKLRAAVAADLSTEVARVSVDAVWADSRTDLDYISRIVFQVLGVPIYPSEQERFSSLRELGAYLSTEIALEIQQSCSPLTDPYEGVNFARAKPLPPIRNKVGKLVFLISAPRSGSTLLRVMLAGHPLVFSPPELHLLIYESMGQRKRVLEESGQEWIRLGLSAAFMEAHGLNRKQAGDYIQKLERGDAPIEEVYRALSDRLNDRLLVDKTPTYAFHSHWLARAEEIAEKPKYIYLSRHPNGVMRSFVQRRFHKLFSKGWPLYDANPWRFAEKIWTACNQNIAEFLSGVDSGRRHWIRYEDLLADTRKTTQELCDFLEIPFDPAVLDPYQGDRMTSFTVGDPFFAGRGRIDPRLAKTWDESQSAYLVGPLTRQLAAKLNYELPALASNPE